MSFPLKLWRLILVNTFIFILSARANPSTLRGPWHDKVSNSVSQKIHSPKREISDKQTLSKTYANQLLFFYQDILSTVMVSHCEMIPSCSTYSVDAVHKHGVFLGVLLTVDRLYHEGSVKQTSPRKFLDGKMMFLDPVGRNDFWWYEKK